MDERGGVEVVEIDLDILVGEGQELDLVGWFLTQPRERDRCVAVADHLIAHALGHRCENLCRHRRAGPGRIAADLEQIAGVGAALDLAQRAAPVGVVRAELLLQGQEPVAQRGVADLELREVAQLALDVGMQIRRGLLLDPQEVLLVQDLHAIERRVERVEQLFDDLRLLGLLLSRLCRHVPAG